MQYVELKNPAQKLAVGKIVCVGRNYSDHAKELGHEVPKFPIIFLKPPSTMIHSGGKIEYPLYSTNLHHEVELVLLIGKRVKNEIPEIAESAIIAYGVGLDMTLRDLQFELAKDGSPWTISKCFDTCAVISDFVRKEKAKDILTLEIQLYVNDQIRQRCVLNEMIFKPADIVSHISHRMALEAGDLIFTGTPAGVSAVQRGDKLKAKIGRLCELTTEII